jgi:hypothetical protein
VNYPDEKILYENAVWAVPGRNCPQMETHSQDKVLPTLDTISYAVDAKQFR